MRLLCNHNVGIYYSACAFYDPRVFGPIGIADSGVVAGLSGFQCLLFYRVLVGILYVIGQNQSFISNL